MNSKILTNGGTLSGAAANGHLTGIPQIDGVVYQLFPAAAHFTEVERIKVASHIEHHLFGTTPSVHEHHMFRDSQIANFLNGVKHYVQTHFIYDFTDLKRHYNSKVAAFDPAIVCEVKK